MVDAARQMLDELMGRNRNLHPSEAVVQVNWDDPHFCQYYMVNFCPHDLFVNTRADLGPCSRIHDDEVKRMYEKARPGAKKRQYEDEFLRFCNGMLSDVDRKIQKGKQRLQLIQKDQPINSTTASRYQEQLNNLNARIKKLLSEAEEAGIRGDVDQAQDLMNLCEQMKNDKDDLISQHENLCSNSKDEALFDKTQKLYQQKECVTSDRIEKERKNLWLHDVIALPEKQMEVCEVCGAFLIVGDAQQRIEDHLTGKQHLGYSKLRKAVEQITSRRQKERDEEQRMRRIDKPQKTSSSMREDHYRNRNDRMGNDKMEYHTDDSKHTRKRHSRSRSRHHDYSNHAHLGRRRH